MHTTTDIASGIKATATPSLTLPQPGDITSGDEEHESSIPPVNGSAFLRMRAIRP